MKGTNLLERLHRAETEAEFERKKRKETEQRYNELLEELRKTQALLCQFLNENTPSSQKPDYDKDKKKPDKPEKP